MGIFGVFGKKKDKQPPKQALTQEELELQKKRAAQDRQIKEINLAKTAYKETGDQEAYLAFWRNLWNEEQGLLIRGNTLLFEYPKLLIKEKQYDEAWGFLNRIVMEYPDNLSRIRNMQFSILKAKRKHPEDAVFFLMSSILLDLKDVHNPISYFDEYGAKQFEKKVKPVAKKAGFTEDEILQLSQLIRTMAAKGRFSETELRKSYCGFLNARKES